MFLTIFRRVLVFLHFSKLQTNLTKYIWRQLKAQILPIPEKSCLLTSDHSKRILKINFQSSAFRPTAYTRARTSRSIILLLQVRAAGFLQYSHALPPFCILSPEKLVFLSATKAGSRSAATAYSSCRCIVG